MSNNAMHPTADTMALIYLQRLARRSVSLWQRKRKARTRKAGALAYGSTWRIWERIAMANKRMALA